MTKRRADIAAFVRDLAGFARGRLVMATGLMVAGALFEGLGLLLLVPLVGVVLDSDRLPPWLAGMDPTVRLAGVIGGFLAVMALRSLVLVWRDRVNGAVQIGWVETVRGRLVDGLARADWSRVSRLSRARVVQALGPELHQLNVATDGLMQAVLAAILLVGLMTIAMVLAPVAGPLALILLAIVGLAGRPYLRRAHALGGRITSAHLTMTDRAMRFLDGLKLAVAEGEQGAFTARYADVSAAAARHKLDNLAMQSRMRNLSAVLAALVAALTLFVGIAMLRIAPPVLVALLAVLARASGPAQQLQQAMQQLLNNLPAYGAIRSLERDLGPVRTVARPRSADPGSGNAVILSRVSFRHGDGKGGVANLDCAIPTGAFVGVTGPSGSGKTTFLDLVAGILTATAGSVRLARGPDGTAPVIAYVGQEPVLFDGSVRDNLIWSRPDATDAEMWAALALTRAAVVVSSLDAQVGERGVLLSAGERQRLALARAILRRPQLLILDEATNAIDIATERAILDALADLPARPTILMAAHRIESFRRCDAMIAFPEGRYDQKNQLAPNVTAVRECAVRA